MQHREARHTVNAPCSAGLPSPLVLVARMKQSNRIAFRLRVLRAPKYDLWFALDGYEDAEEGDSSRLLTKSAGLHPVDVMLQAR